MKSINRILALVAPLLVAALAGATQFPLNTGDDLDDIIPKLSPGDEIILMPGEHGNIALKDIHGQPGNPITIRGLHRSSPGPIRSTGKAWGIHLRGCTHIVLQDLFIFGASDAGILVDSPQSDKIVTGNITIDHVVVTQTGDMVGDHDAIRLHGVSDVKISNCRIEGWTYSAIDIVACRHVEIEKCRLTKREGYPTINGITVRAGSQNVHIQNTRFEAAGVVSVTCGGASANSEFRPPATNDAEPGTLVEASDVSIDNCLFVMGHAPVAFINAQSCSFRNNTIPYAKETVIVAARQTHDPRYAKTRDISFGSNIILWGPGDLRSIARIDDSLDPSTFNLETNIWWSPDIETTFDKLGPLPGNGKHPQITDFNPKLDFNFHPTEPDAMIFGASTGDQ